MDDQQIREITQMAFRAHFRDVDIVRVNVRRGFDHEDDPGVEVNIIYDGKYELSSSGSNSASYTVKLAVEPITAVSFAVTSSDTDAVTSQTLRCSRLPLDRRPPG